MRYSGTDSPILSASFQQFSYFCKEILCLLYRDSDERHQKTNLIRMMKETNIHSQVTSTIAGDDGEAVAKSEGYVAENGFVATDPTHFGKMYHDKLL
jgi:hypothetical protein